MRRFAHRIVLYLLRVCLLVCARGRARALASGLVPLPMASLRIDDAGGDDGEDTVVIGLWL